MLIFDSFETLEKAEAFASFVRGGIGYGAKAYSERRDDIDPFPFELTAPVVYVVRASEKIEAEMREVAKRYGGVFAGT